MQDAIRVVAGDCTTTSDGRDARRERGEIVALVKPDNTVLVHDARGYQPAAWLTRAETVRFTDGEDGTRLVAGKGDESLRLDFHAVHGRAFYPASPSGPEVGTCPDCDGPLVRSGSDLTCISCRRTHAIPRDADVLGTPCEDCGLPLLRVERGRVFEVCADPSCDPLADAVAAEYDGAWPCPDCGTGMNIEWRRGVRAVCPDCERVLAVPHGRTDATCDCGLPRFETPGGTRCLDSTCDAD